MRQRSSLLKAVITAFPSVSLPFLAIPLLSQPTVAISCWIGLNDNFQERRLVWSDGSQVNYLNWAAGEPDTSNWQFSQGEDVVEMDFRLIGRCEGGAYAANANNGCETEEFRNGEWNDNQNGGDGNNTPEFALCESATFTNPETATYVGCFVDSSDRDMDGLAGDGGAETPYFLMGDSASIETCALKCAGFRYMALQYGQECYCDNANAMQTAADESECDMPCQTADGAPASTTMCGGGFRNSIYSLTTNNWEMPGFDDRSWESAADLGANGIAPWRRRHSISNKAHWIWSSDPVNHDHIFCRFTEPNTEMNCPAAQSAYLQVRQRGVLSFRGSGHCLSFCFSSFPCGSTALTA
eukprot:SAG22_NODE_2551_length_2454_cov_1.402548_3_plen_353_part_01